MNQMFIDNYNKMQIDNVNQMKIVNNNRIIEANGYINTLALNEVWKLIKNPNQAELTRIANTKLVEDLIDLLYYIDINPKDTINSNNMLIELKKQVESNMLGGLQQKINVVNYILANYKFNAFGKSKNKSASVKTNLSDIKYLK